MRNAYERQILEMMLARRPNMGPMTRRHFLSLIARTTIGGAAALSVLAACGGDDDDDGSGGSGNGSEPTNTTTEGSGGSTSEATESSSSGDTAAMGDVGDELVVFGYGGIFDHAIPSFEEKTGIKVIATPWASEAEAVNKLRLDPSGIDVVSFCAATSFDQLRTLDLLEAIDVSRIPNWDNIQPTLIENFPLNREDGVIDHIPFDWGATGLMWDTSQTGGPLDSWTALLDPKYKNRTSLEDSGTQVFQIARFIEGVDASAPPTTTEEIDAMVPTMRALLEQTRALWTSGDDLVQLMGNGEVWVSDAWDGLAIQLINEGFDTVDFIRAPKEGGLGWSCANEILRDAPNPEGAYLWLDHFISKEVQMEYTRLNGYACASVECAEGLEEADPTLYERMGLNQAAEMIPRLRILPPWDQEMQAYAIEKWTELKAG